MSKKRDRPEAIVGNLRAADVPISQGKNVVEAIKDSGITDVTYSRWWTGSRTPRCQGRCRRAPDSLHNPSKVIR